MFQRGRDDRHAECAALGRDHGKTNPVDGHRALGHKILGHVRGRVKTPQREIALIAYVGDASYSVHMPQHEMPAEPAVGAHGPFEIDRMAGFQCAQGSARAALGRHLRHETVRVECRHGQTDAVNRDAVAQIQIVQHRFGDNGKVRAAAS